MENFGNVDSVVLQNALLDVLTKGIKMGDTVLANSSISTLFDAGILTTDDGLCIRTSDGSEFQLIIIQNE